MTATADAPTTARIPLAEAARLVRRSRKSLLAHIEAGAIRGWRVGGRIEVSREDIARFAEGTPIQAAQKT